MNILGKRYIFFFISLAIIIPGIILALTGLPLGIDFTGGSLLTLKFASGELPQPAEVVTLLNELGFTEVQVQPTDQGTMLVRFAFIENLGEGTRNQVVSGEAFSQRFNDTVSVLQFDTVGPTIGKEVAGRAALAVGIAAAVVIVYIAFAFRGLSHSLRYGICAIIAMFHDVAIVISLGAIGGKIFGWQMDALFLTALLTVIGFSVQDKIVVFDRIRENTNIYRRLEFETLVNHSIVQTLQRSINTQLMTVEFMLLSLAMFGGVTLREFAVILLVGLASGTYSSIFIAASTLVVWENKEWKTWFRKGGTTPAAA